jgi:uncharacterized membrane protein
MEEWLHRITARVVVIIDAMALIIVAVGTVEAFFAGLRAACAGPSSSRRVRAVWERYGRWLVAGLTFQVAADIVGTAIAPTWEEIGKLGAIAAIRTALNFFLERDLAELGEREAEPVKPGRTDISAAR